MLLLTLFSAAALGRSAAPIQPQASFNPEFATPGKAFVLTVSSPPGLIPAANLRRQRIALVAHGEPCQSTNAGIRPSSLALREPVAAGPGEASWDVVIDTMHDSDLENSYDVCFCAGVSCNQYSNFQRLEQPGIITVVAASETEDAQPSMQASASLSAAEAEVATKEISQLKSSVDSLQSDISAADGGMQDRIAFAKVAISEKSKDIDKNVSEVTSLVKEGVAKLSAVDVGEASLKKELQTAKEAEAAVYHGEMILTAREDHAAKRARNVAERDQRFGKALFARGQRALNQLQNVEASEISVGKSIDEVTANLGAAQHQLENKMDVQKLDARVRALE